MTTNECLIEIPGISQNPGFRIRIFESTVTFKKREFFEHKHSDFEISYIENGSGVYDLKNERCAFSANDIFIFGTNVIHCITDTESENNTKLINIQFEPRMIWSPNSNLMGSCCYNLFNRMCEKLDKNTQLYTSVLRLIHAIYIESIERRNGYQLMIKAYICEIIGNLIRDGKYSDQGTDMTQSSSALLSIDNAMTYINNNLDKKLMLEDIAKVAGFSRTYFSSLFSRLNGLSPWEYITIKRIEKSKILLKSTGYTIIEIAELCGFSNISNFNRIFQRSVGTTPSKYRKIFKNET